MYEPNNIGMLCTRTNPKFKTKLFVRLMISLLSKRYRRILHFNLLYDLLGDDGYRFGWDRDGGCTRYHSHCNYIHFTRPKDEEIRKALVALGKEKTITNNTT